MDSFDLGPLRRRLASGRWLAQEIRELGSCRSSNGSARTLLEEGETLDSTLLIAWEQVEGRGRTANDWWSGPAGANLAVTLCHREEKVRPELFGLLGAVALTEVLGHRLGDPTRLALKWPNDILLDGAKVAGFLGEQPANGDGVVLLGLGCNLSAAPPTQVAPYPTTSLATHLAPDVACPEVPEIVGAWLWAFEHGLRRFVLRGPEAFEEAFLALLRRWAPHGVADPRDGRGGPLLEFSVSRGLRWGKEADADFHPLGWIPTLEPLQP